MENKQLPSSKKAILVSICFAIVAYIIIIFILWISTLYHEAGHMQACNSLNIFCQENLKSFSEYVTFMHKNFFLPAGSFATMSIQPNETEFCNLSNQEQQLIRVGGFRRDIFVSFAILSILVIEIVLFTYSLSRIYQKKKKPRFRFFLFWGLLGFSTVLILYLILGQLSSYFLKNVGDLFYFPC